MVNRAADKRLRAAVRADDPSNLEKALHDGASFDTPDGSGARPLHLGAKHGALQTIRILLEARADPNALTDKITCYFFEGSCYFVLLFLTC